MNNIQRLFLIVKRYSLPFLATSTALLLTLLLWSVLKETPALLFFGSVMISGWQGGLKSGLLATSLSIICLYYLFGSPVLNVVQNWGDLVRLIMFGLVGTLISFLNEKRRMAEEKARRNEEQMRLIADTVPAPICYLDAEMRYQFNNKAYKEWFGYCSKHIKAKYRQDASGRLIFQVIQNSVKEALLGKKISEEKSVCTIDGFLRYIQATYAPHFTKQGEVEGVVVAINDLTEHKKNQQALEKERDFIETIFSTVNSLIVVLNQQGQIVRFNQACQRITGYSFAEVKDKYVWNLLIPETEIEAVKGVFRNLCAGNFPSQYENDWLAKDGSHRLISWSNTAILDKEGIVEYVIGTGIDITDRRAAETALAASYNQLENHVRERTAELLKTNQALQAEIAERQKIEAALSHSQQQFKAVVENTPDVIIRLDKEGRYLYVNPVVERIQGMAAGAIIGKTSQELGISPELCNFWEEAIAKVFATKTEQTIEYRIPDADQFRTFQSRIVPEFGQDGNVQSALVVARDITELKQAEAERILLAAEQAARAKAEVEQQRAAFIAEASKVLATFLDSETALRKVAELAVPTVADGCIIHLLNSDGSIDPVALTHIEPSAIALLQTLEQRYPTYPNASHGYPLVLRTSQPELIVEMSDDVLVSIARDPEHLEMLRQLDLGSNLCVPLVARGQVLGAIAFITVHSGRRYSDEDITLFTDLAYHCALAIDNRRLYRETQQALSQTAETCASIDALLATAPLGLCFLDRDLRFIRINQVLAELNGLSVEAHLGRNIHEIFPQSAAKFEPLIRQVLDTGEPLLNVEINGSPPGKPNYFGHWLGSYYPVKNESGQVLGIGMILTEITEAKRAETALRESEARFRSVVESNMIGIGFWEQDGSISDANDALLQMVGYTKEELISGKLRWTDLTPPEFAALDRQALAELEVSNCCTPYEKEYIRSDGHRLPILAGGGHLQGCKDKGAFFVLDISDRKQAEEALRTSEDRIQRQLAELDHLYNTTPVGLCFVDLSLRYVRINEHLAAMNGKPIAQHLGRSLREVLPEMADILEPLYRQAIETQTPILNLEIQGNTAQQPGIVRDWLVSQYPVTDESGALLGVSSVVQEISDRKRAERALRESEAIFRRLFEADIFGVAIGDSNGKLTYANDAFLKMVGYTREETIAGELQWERMTPPEYQKLDAQASEELRTTGVATPFKKEYIRKDGRHVPVLVGQAVLNAPDRTQDKIIGFYIDLTEIEQVEAELKKNQDRLQLAQQAGKIGTFESNIQTGEVTWTQELEALYGLAPGTFGGTYDHWLQLVHPRDRTMVDQEFQAAVASGSELNIEFRICRREGSARWLAARATVLPDDRGLPCRMVGVNVDIGDRKQAQEALLEINRTLEALIQACPLGITVFSADDGSVKMWNPAAEQIFGWRESEVLDSILPSVPEEKRGEFIANLKKIREGTALTGIETRRQRKDGSAIEVNLWATPVPDAKGNINCMSIVADISDRKRDEAERAQLLVREQAARSEAETMNRMKDEFLATLSHELRTPLNAILGWSQLLRTRKLNEATMARALETIERQARIQTQLVDDLLNVSRIIQGKLCLNIGWFDLGEVIEASMNSVGLMAQTKSINLECDLDPRVGLVWGDAERLQQVVWNLLSNAIKFTPSGGLVEVKLSVQEGEKVNLSSQTQTFKESSAQLDLANSKSQYALIQVRDTGRGIAPEFIPYVFERFRQADGSITRVYGGLGLGLAIVRHLVELHGGTVTAESEGEGKGATFTVKLPMRKVKGEQLLLAGMGESAIASPSNQVKKWLEGLQVLVVDDDADTREFLIALLEESGATAIAVSSASEAIAALEHWHPDVLVSDIGMPYEDGYSLIHRIRALESGQAEHLPAVALTAYAREQDRYQALEAGYNEHLTKPVEPHELLGTLVKLIDGI